MAADDWGKTCPCRWCGTPTRMLFTKECDRCHELRTRIEWDPELARQIMATVAPDMQAAAYNGLTHLQVHTRHPQDYVLVNEQDGTRWRGTADGRWVSDGSAVDTITLTLDQANTLLDALDVGLDSVMYEAENANGSHEDAAKVNAAITMLGQLIEACSDGVRSTEGGPTWAV